MRVKEVLGFFRFGGVLFWYGCPIRRVMGKAAGGREGGREKDDCQTKKNLIWRNNLPKIISGVNNDQITRQDTDGE